MLDKFKSLSTFSKVLVVAAGVLLVACIGCVVAVFATGGFNGI